MTYYDILDGHVVRASSQLYIMVHDTALARQRAIGGLVHPLRTYRFPYGPWPVRMAHGPRFWPGMGTAWPGDRRARADMARGTRTCLGHDLSPWHGTSTAR